MTTASFELQIEKIKADLKHRLGPAVTISILGKEAALPAAKTIHNLRSMGKIPQAIFFRGPSGVLADTDRFLDWWVSRCSRV